MDIVRFLIIRCDWSTPLGVPVVPLVKARPRMSSSSTATSGSTSSPDATTASYSSYASPAPSSVTSRSAYSVAKGRSISAYLVSVNTARGLAVRNSAAVSPGRSRLLSGTYVAPIFIEANSTSAYAMLLLAKIASRSPLPNPRRRSAEASRLTREFVAANVCSSPDPVDQARTVREPLRAQPQVVAGRGTDGTNGLGHRRVVLVSPHDHSVTSRKSVVKCGAL